MNPSAIVRRFHRALLLDVVAVGGARASCDGEGSCAASKCCGLQKLKDELNKAIVGAGGIVRGWRGAASVALRAASLRDTSLNARAVSLIP